MTSQRTRELAGTSLLALAAWSCDLTTAPATPPLDLALDFCSTETPIWFAYQNHSSSDWVRVTPDAQGRFRFTADYRVALAYVFQSGSDYRTELVGATNIELKEISDVTCLEETGTKQVSGSVAGISGSQVAQVSMMFASPYLQSPQTSFTLQNLPDRSLDLVASRVIFTGTTSQASDRIIVRKNLNPTNGATLQVLDFGSAEAVTPTTNAITVNGVGSVDDAGLYNYFFSAQGTSHLLYFSSLSSPGSVTLPSVPSVPVSQTAVGDYHDMFVIANTAQGTFRGAETFFRTPSDKALTLGGQPLVPTFTSVATTPYLRHQIQQSIAPEYSSVVRFALRQQFQQFSVTQVNVTVTLPYLSSRLEIWDVTIPDLSGVEGWQNAWGLQNGTPVSWEVTTYSGRSALVLGATGHENELVTFAGRSSTLQALRAMQAYRLGPIAPRRGLSSRAR